MFPAVARSSLALYGGPRVRTRPFPAWPQFSEDEVAAVTELMRSGQVNYFSGEHGRRFEQEFAAACQCQHAVSVANGTLALELALRSLGIGGGDEVITPSRTFIASASCIAMCGARPVFAEVERESQNVSAKTIRAALSRKTKAVIVVHLAGYACEMEPILELTREYNLFLVEDCAQAQGATWKGRPVGSFGDVAAFSFCQDKIMTTLGEGGMLTTNNAELWERAWAFRDHGRQPQQCSDGRPNQNNHGFLWQRSSLGSNWRMTQAQSAVGRVQLRNVQSWLEVRRAHARQLTSRLRAIEGLRLPAQQPQAQPAWYRFYAFVRPEKLVRGWNRDLVTQAINAEGVPCNVGSCSEVYLEQVFRDVAPPQRHGIAKELGETSLAFLLHPTLTASDIEDTCAAVEKVMAAATSVKIASAASSAF